MLKRSSQKTWVYVRNRLGLKRAPLQVSLQVTTACNLGCSYCYADAENKRNNELTTQEIKQFLNDLKKMDIAILVFTGGEPLLRNDLDELIKYASSINLNTCIATNGILLSRDRANKLKESGLKVFHFSIDGSCDEMHGIYRGKNNFDKSIQGLKNAVDAGLPVVVQTMLTDRNRHDLDNIAALLVSFGVRTWRLQLIVPCGRGISLLRLEDSPRYEIIELMEKVYSLSNKYKNDMKIDFHALQFYKVFLYRKRKTSLLSKFTILLKGGCAAIEGHIIYVDSDGSVRPCPHFPYILPNTNIRMQNIADIYRGNPIIRQLRDKNNLKGRCKICKYQYFCGGCRAKVFAQTGDFFEGDKDCPFF